MSWKEIVSKRSSCESCGKVLGAFELIPIFSYIFLSGRCRKCGISIGKKIFIAEITYLLTALSLYYIDAPIWQYFVLFVLLFASFYDYQTQQIPKFAVHGLLVLALLILLGQLYSDLNLPYELALKAISLLSALVFTATIVVANRFKSYMGMGDVLIIAALGFISYGLEILSILFIASLAGLLFVLGLYFKKRKISSQYRISFVPFLTIGYMITLVLSPLLGDWFTSYLLIW